MISPDHILSPGASVRFLDLNEGIAFTTRVRTSFNLNYETHYELEPDVSFHPDSIAVSKGRIDKYTSQVPSQLLMQFNVPRGSLVMFTKISLQRGNSECLHGWVRDCRINMKNGKMFFYYSVSLKSNPKIIEVVQVGGLGKVGEYYLVHVMKWGIDKDFPRLFKKRKVVI